MSSAAAEGSSKIQISLCGPSLRLALTDSAFIVASSLAAVPRTSFFANGTSITLIYRLSRYGLSFCYVLIGQSVAFYDCEVGFLEQAGYQTDLCAVGVVIFCHFARVLDEDWSGLLPWFESFCFASLASCSFSFPLVSQALVREAVADGQVQGAPGCPVGIARRTCRDKRK